MGICIERCIGLCIGLRMGRVMRLTAQAPVPSLAATVASFDGVPLSAKTPVSTGGAVPAANLAAAPGGLGLAGDAGVWLPGGRAAAGNLAAGEQAASGQRPGAERRHLL